MTVGNAGRRDLQPSLDEIAADRTHGAAWLSLRALELLQRRASELHGVEAGGEWQELAALAAALIAARPSMAVVRNRVNRLMHGSRGRSAAELVELAGRLIAEAATADRAAATAAAGHVAGRRVLTLSRSATVETALATAQPPPVAVLVAESRPGGEGREVAAELARRGLPVTLLPDAAVAAALAAPGADVVLVGADAVLPDGSVVNKVGTRVVALAAREEGVPCYAVAALDKIGDATAGDEQGDSAELFDGKAPLTVWAPLFEATPAGLFTAILTERGPLTPAEVASAAAELAALAEWTFG